MISLRKQIPLSINFSHNARNFLILKVVNFIFLFVSTFVFLLLDDNFGFQFNKVIFIILLFINLIGGKIIFGWFSLYVIHLLSSCFFVYNSLIFDYLDNFKLLEILYPARYVFNEKTGAIFTYCAILNIIFLSLGFLCGYRSRDNFFPVFKEKQNASILYKYGLALMLICFVPKCYCTLVQVSYVAENGYWSVYNGGLASLRVSKLAGIVDSGYTIGYLATLACFPALKNFITCSLIYAFGVFLAALKGGRTEFIVTLSVLLYLYVHFYQKEKKINYRSVLFFLLFFFSFSIGIRKLRDSYSSPDFFLKKDPFHIELLNFLQEQTITRAVPLIVMEFDKLENQRYPFIFSPFINLYDAIKNPHIGQDDTYLLYWNNPSALCTYTISPYTYYLGGGLGSSYLAEFFDLSKYMGVIFGSTLLGFFIAWIEAQKRICTYLFPFYFYCLKSIIYLPRTAFFLPFSYAKLIILSTIFICVISIYENNSNKKQF